MKSPRIFAFAGWKGGSGRTTGSILLASYLSFLGGRCLLIAIRPEGLHFWLEAATASPFDFRSARDLSFMSNFGDPIGSQKYDALVFDLPRVHGVDWLPIPQISRVILPVRCSVADVQSAIDDCMLWLSDLMPVSIVAMGWSPDPEAIDAILATPEKRKGWRRCFRGSVGDFDTTELSLSDDGTFSIGPSTLIAARELGKLLGLRGGRG